VLQKVGKENEILTGSRRIKGGKLRLKKGKGVKTDRINEKSKNGGNFSIHIWEAQKGEGKRLHRKATSVRIIAV